MVTQRKEKVKWKNWLRFRKSWKHLRASITLSVNTNTEVLIDNSKNGNEDNNIVENNEEQIEHIKEDENNQVASLSPRSNESKEAKSIINEEEPEVNDINEVKDANGHEEQNVNEVISNIREEEKKEEVESPYIVDSNNNEEEIIKLKKEIMSLNNQLHVAKLKESSFEAECNQYKNQIKSQSEIISQYKLKEINEEKYKKEIEILKSTLTWEPNINVKQIKVIKVPATASIARTKPILSSI